MCLSVYRCICVEKKSQLDVTECFIALMICSTCFGHFYAHHQERENIYVITAYGVQCLVAGCRGSGAGQQAMRPGRGMLHDCSRAASLLLDAQPAVLHLTPTTSNQALHTIGLNNIYILALLMMGIEVPETC